ncbi:hypothetical protein ACQVP2_07385 [Methylobacterium aquaticum]|uniref:hypothetical protein n=1 Tax=Methylobacterium aquaticum TaxID=270351 RepID=UPI003D164DCA
MPRRPDPESTPTGVWALTCSTADLGAIFDMTARRVLQLEAEGVLRRNDHNQWPVARNFQAFLAHRLRQEADDQADSEEGRRLRNLKADEISLRVEERSRALVAEARAEALAIVDEVAGQLQPDLMAIPARVTTDLALRRRIEDEISIAFGAMSKRLASQAAGAPAGGADAPKPNRQQRRASRRGAR